MHRRGPTRRPAPWSWSGVNKCGFQGLGCGGKHARLRPSLGLPLLVCVGHGSAMFLFSFLVRGIWFPLSELRLEGKRCATDGAGHHTPTITRYLGMRKDVERFSRLESNQRSTTAGRELGSELDSTKGTEGQGDVSREYSCGRRVQGAYRKYTGQSTELR